MSIFDQTASAGGSTEKPSEANHSGALVAIIDLGTHTEQFKATKAGEKDKTSDVRKLALIFELDEKLSGTTGNHVILKECSLTTSPKSTLRKIMESMRGKAYAEGEKMDITKALGRPCLVDVKHKASGSGSVYAKLESITKLPPSMPAFKPSLPLTIWEIGSDKPFPKYTWLPYSFLNGQLCPLEKVMQASKEMRPAAGGQTTPVAPGNGQGNAPISPPPGAGTPEDPVPF